MTPPDAPALLLSEAEALQRQCAELQRLCPHTELPAEIALRAARLAAQHEQMRSLVAQLIRPELDACGGVTTYAFCRHCDAHWTVDGSLLGRRREEWHEAGCPVSAALAALAGEQP